MERELKTTLGWHWILDAFDCERDCLSDLELMSRVLTGLPAALSLTCVGEPQLFDHRPDDEQDRCLVGLMMIAESHLSIHARPGRGLIHADLFSCVEFDQDQALEYLRRSYRFSHHEEQRLHRGAVPARGRVAE